MKIKKIIAWSGTIVLACIIIFTVNYLYTYKLERETSLDKKNRSESLLKKGIYHYKAGKIDSSLTYLFKSMNLQPRSKSSYEASYWIAKNYFNLFGCDSVSLIKKFIDYANKTNDEIVLRESNSLLAKIYAYTFRFPEARNIHENNYKRAKLNKDTIGIVENAAKLLRLSVAGSDGYSPYINTEPEDYYFPDITDTCNSRTIPKYLFLCEFLIFSDRFTSNDIDQLSRKDLLEVNRLINPYVKSL